MDPGLAVMRLVRLLLLLGFVSEGELRVADAARVQAVVYRLALDKVLERHYIRHPVVHKRGLHERLGTLHSTSESPHLSGNTVSCG